MEKGRVIGFIALGALVLLVAIAFLPDDDGTVNREPVAADQTPPPGTSGSPTPANTPPPPEQALPDTSLTQSIPNVQPGMVTAKAAAVSLSPQARLLAERFMCVCGCDNMILSTCNCLKTPGSRDMKQYLQQLVDAGETPVSIRNAMVTRYGTQVLP